MLFDGNGWSGDFKTLAILFDLMCMYGSKTPEAALKLLWIGGETATNGVASLPKRTDLCD